MATVPFRAEIYRDVKPLQAGFGGCDFVNIFIGLCRGLIVDGGSGGFGLAAGRSVSGFSF